MINLDPKGFTAVANKHFEWFLKTLASSGEERCANGSCWRNSRGEIVAMKIADRCFVKVKA